MRQRRELVYVALSRLVAIPLYVGLLAIEERPYTTWVWIVVVGACFYVGLTLWLAVSPRWENFDPRWLIPLDLVLVGMAVAASGGPDSGISVVYFVWLVAMAILYEPRMILVCALAVLFAFGLVSLPFALDSEEDFRAMGVGLLSLAWIGLVTLFVADAFWRRQERIERLSSARQRLLMESLSAEERARKRLSQNLHDDALQVLLAAGQDLDSGLRGDRSMLERGREEVRVAVARLRETVRGLHPAALEHGGLAGAIDSAVERAATRGGFVPDVRIDSRAAGVHDQLLISIATELATNVSKHAEAETLSVELTRTERELVLEVNDDGRGMTPDLRESALAAGHIGLASCAERVEAAGGELEIESTPGAGTAITVRLPADAAKPH